MGESVLLVEDDETVLVGMRRYLTSRGYRVDCARQAEEAERALALSRYACVIVDMQLAPQQPTGGLAVIAAVRRAWPATRIITLTASGSAEVEADARRLGTDVYLRKPTPMDELARRLSDLLEVGR